jgi:hypothetical protein
VLDVDTAALYPNFPGDDFSFSIQKERHRQKNNAAVALFKRGSVANDNRVVDVHFSCVVRDVLCASEASKDTPMTCKPCGLYSFCSSTSVGISALLACEANSRD